jgi:hypothetical protein
MARTYAPRLVDARVDAGRPSHRAIAIVGASITNMRPRATGVNERWPRPIAMTIRAVAPPQVAMKIPEVSYSSEKCDRASARMS